MQLPKLSILQKRKLHSDAIFVINFFWGGGMGVQNFSIYYEHLRFSSSYTEYERVTCCVLALLKICPSVRCAPVENLVDRDVDVFSK
jgi:hypothetical protein